MDFLLTSVRYAREMGKREGEIVEGSQFLLVSVSVGRALIRDSTKECWLLEKHASNE